MWVPSGCSQYLLRLQSSEGLIGAGGFSSERPRWSEYPNNVVAAPSDSRVRGEDALGPLDLVSEDTQVSSAPLHLLEASHQVQPTLQGGQTPPFERRIGKGFGGEFPNHYTVYLRGFGLGSLKCLYKPRQNRGLLSYPAYKLPSWLAQPHGC